MDPYSATDRARLMDAMRYWERYFEPFNIDRSIQIEEFARSKQADGLVPENLDEIYFNLIQLTALASNAAVSFNAPKFCASYEDPQAKGFARKYEGAVNKYMDWIRYHETLREILLDARFGWGVRQIHLGDSAFATDNVLREAGVPQIEPISQENFLWEGNVRKLTDSLFQASRYQMVYRDALNSARFDKALRQELKPMAQKGKGSDRHPEEASVEEMVELIDVYFPRERIVCTWQASEGEFAIEENDPLCVHPWSLTRSGPYSVLALCPSPGRLIPVSPMDAIENLFLLFNHLWKSMAWEALSEKMIFTYEGGSEDDVGRMLNARNRDLVRVNGKDRVGSFNFPGVSQSKSNYVGQVLALAKEAGGNVNFKAGLGPSSGTASQDQMIATRVGILEAEEARLIHEFVSQDGDDIGHMLFDDPNLVIPFSLEIEGTDYTVPSAWYPSDVQPRQGSADDYGVELIPYSMDYVDANDKIQYIDESVMACVNAAGASMQLGQLGIMFDVEAYMELRAKLRHLPELKRLFYFQPPMGQPTSAMDAGGKMKPAGPREYIRRNVSERTNDGTLMQLMQHGGAAEQPVMQ